MSKSGISTSDRLTVAAALEKAEQTGAPAVAIEINDGRIVTGKTGKLLGASAAALLNALKALGGIDDKIELISPTIIEPIQQLKVKHMYFFYPVAGFRRYIWLIKIPDSWKLKKLKLPPFKIIMVMF